MRRCFLVVGLLAVFCVAAARDGWSQQQAAPSTAQNPVVVKLFTDDIAVAPDGLSTYTIHLEEQANNVAAAQRMAQESLPYSESTEDLEITEAYTLKADGRKIPVANAAIYTQLPPGASQLPMFDDRRQKVIVFPDVAAGDNVVYTCVYREKKAALPGQVMLSFPFSRLYAYDEARVTLVAPKTISLVTETHDVGFEKQDGDTQETYRWHYSAPNPILEDNSVLAAFNRSPRFLVSSFKDYDAFAHAYAAVISGTNAVTPKIKSQADLITAGVTDRRQQAKKIYEWVSQHVRYVGIEVGVGSLIPHDAETVLSNGYGDCKDHVVLFSALLKAKGINSEFVLINLGNNYELPGTAVVGELNHAITWLPEFHLYADTTAGVAPFGVLPFPEYGKPVVHAVATGSAMHRIPVLEADLATVKVSTSAHIDEKDHLSGQSQTTASGPFSVELRQFGLTIQGSGSQRVAAAYLQHLGLPGTADFTVPPPTEAGPDYNLSASFDLGPFQDLTAGRRMVMPSYFDLMGSPGDTLLGSLQNTKIGDDDPTPCFSGRMVQDVQVDPPAGRTFYNLPENTEIKTANLTYTAHWSLTGQSAILHREINTQFDTALCSGSVRTDTAKAIAKIRDSLSGAIALTQSVSRPQAVVTPENFTPVSDFAPSQLSLDVEGGHFREWRKDLICPVNGMQVTFTVNKTTPDPKWASLAQLVINPPVIIPGSSLVDPKSQAVAFWLTMRNGRLMAELVKRTGADFHILESIPFSTPAEVGKPLNVFVTWKDDGTVLATLNKTESYSLHLDVPVTSVQLMASGAQVDFDKIQPGQSGSAPGKCAAAANAPAAGP